jgi:hypothetical protein
MMSDCSRSGLRGAVKSCTEERLFNEFRSEYTTEYNSDGRIRASRSRNTDGSFWVTRYEYAASGQLLKIASGTVGQALTETHYSYDQQGRLQKITTDGRGETPVSFGYGESGQKTKIQVSRAEDYRPNTATAGSPFEAADRTPNLPGGGSATTIYDEHDRPTEVQVRDASGELVSHALRRYDAEGRVTEEKLILDDLVSMFPPDVCSKMLEESGLSIDQLRQQLGAELTSLMAGKNGISVSYRYDSSGHLMYLSRRSLSHEDEVETTYNEHGDVASEITRSMRLAGANESATTQSSAWSEVQYAYEYDQHGNWTVKTVSYRSSSDAAFQSSSVSKRLLTYY